MPDNPTDTDGSPVVFGELLERTCYCIRRAPSGAHKLSAVFSGS